MNDYIPSTPISLATLGASERARTLLERFRCHSDHLYDGITSSANLLIESMNAFRGKAVRK